VWFAWHGNTIILCKPFTVDVKCSGGGIMWPRAVFSFLMCLILGSGNLGRWPFSFALKIVLLVICAMGKCEELSRTCCSWVHYRPLRVLWPWSLLLPQNTSTSNKRHIEYFQKKLKFNFYKTSRTWVITRTVQADRQTNGLQHVTSCAARWPPQYAPAPADRRPTCLQI